MQELKKALEKVARKIIWRDSSKSKHTSNDLKRIYDCRQFEGNAWFLLASYKAEISQDEIVALAARLRPVLTPYINSETDRIGNGLFSLLPRGPGEMQEPTVAQFVQVLMNGVVLLGAERVTQLLNGWIKGAPLHYRKRALLVGVTIDQPLKLDEGISITKLPSSFLDLSASIPYGSETPVEPYLGGVMLSVDCEMSPALYAPEKKDPRSVWKPSDALSVTTSGNMPNYSHDTFCEAMSLACNHYVDWQSRGCDYGELQAFLMMSIGGAYKTLPRPSAVPLSQEQLEQARDIHLLRYANGEAKRGLDTAISRWMRSKQTNAFIDKFIELRIALEALYLKDESGEKGFRLAAYGAWHLSANYEERRTCFVKLRNLYDRASKVVHAGNIKVTKENRELLTSAQDICRNGILLRLKETQEPQWDDWVLGQSQNRGEDGILN